MIDTHKNKDWQVAGITFLIMIFASLSVIIPLTIFKNLVLVFFIYYIGMCITVPFIDLLVIKRLNFADSMRFLGFSHINRKKSVRTGLLHGLMLAFLTIVSFFIFNEFFMSSDIPSSLARWGVLDQSKWLIFILMVLFNGIIEEIFWRGYTFGKLRGHLNKWFTIAATTTFYTSYHLATVFTFFKISFLSIQIVLFIFVAGLIWGWMRYSYNNIWACAIGHTLVTLGYMTVYLLL